jgi:hypothetical protein
MSLFQATEQPRINQDTFLDDFEQGWNRYLLRVGATGNDELTQNFQLRFDEVFHD